MAKFQPGQSGNPAGRPRGVGTIGKLRSAIEKDAPGSIARLVEAALAGDTQAAGILLSRVIPPLRAAGQPIPSLTISNLAEAPQAILASLGRGSLTVEQAAGIAQLLTALGRAQEILELTARVAALEERHAQRP